jgi:Dolichyl-phosphate-mannose-protein mannosyltransferase
MLRPYLIAICLVVSFGQSWFLARAMVPDIDETEHIFLGRAAVTGKISLFQDELPGFKAPLPFYFFGLTHLVFGGSIVASRLCSAAVGTLCLLLVLLLATRLAGSLCGLLTFLFAVTESVIIGAFAQTLYHTLVCLFLLAGLYLVLCSSVSYKNVMAMALCSLLFFTRTLMMPLIPLAMVYLIAKATSSRERWWIVVTAVLPPLIFFLCDVRHLKLLAWVPVFGSLVRPLGFQTASRITSVLLYETTNTPTAAVILLARWYKAWIIAGGALAAAIAYLALRRRDVKAFFSDRNINLVAGLFVYIAVWHLVAARASWTGFVGYVPSFGLLVAILLGFGFSVLITGYCTSAASRRAVVLFLSGLFLVAPVLSRPAALPPVYQRPPTLAIIDVADILRTLIPAGSHVFHLGAAQALYIAGREPYLRQAFGFWTLSALADDRVREKSGLWGEPEIAEWLTHDADYAVIVPASLENYRISCRRCIETAETLLARHFSRIAALDQYGRLTHVVYKRK